MMELFNNFSRFNFQTKTNYILFPRSSCICPPKSKMITFPDGMTPEDYGLHPLKRLSDIDTLPRFETIQYLEALCVKYHVMSNIDVLRQILKDAVRGDLDD